MKEKLFKIFRFIWELIKIISIFFYIIIMIIAFLFDNILNIMKLILYGNGVYWGVMKFIELKKQGMPFKEALGNVLIPLALAYVIFQLILGAYIGVPYDERKRY